MFESVYLFQFVSVFGFGSVGKSLSGKKFTAGKLEVEIIRVKRGYKKRLQNHKTRWLHTFRFWGCPSTAPKK